MPSTPSHSHPLHPRQERHFPPYAPEAAPRGAGQSRGLVPQVLLAAAALLVALGLAGGDRSPAIPSPVSPQTAQFQPSEAAEMYLDKAHEESTEPLNPSLAEQELSRALAELDVEMSRTERLAVRLGQNEAFNSLRDKHDDLNAAVAGRATPWKESERAELERRTSFLRAELAKFSMELQEIATVRL